MFFSNQQNSTQQPTVDSHAVKSQTDRTVSETTVLNNQVKITNDRLNFVKSTRSPDWNCQWSPSAMSEQISMLPKKESKYSYNAFQMTSQKSI